MLQLIKQFISWEKIGTEWRDSAIISLEKGTMNPENNSLTLWLKSNVIFPFEDLQKIREAIHKKIPSLKEVRFQFEYMGLKMPWSLVIPLYIPYLVEESNGMSRMMTNTIRPEEICVRNEGTGNIWSVVIPVLGETTATKCNEELKVFYQEILKERLGVITRITFENHLDRYEKTQQEKRAKLYIELKEAEEKRLKAEKANGGAGEKRKVSASVLGKPIKEDPVSISKIQVDMERVVVQGRLFKKDVRTIKNNKKLATLLITDRSSSLCCKLFCSDEKWNELDEALEKDCTIKVLGQPEWDTFENTLVLKTLAIRREEQASRQDLAEEKRVELHCHTKMSENDGLIGVKELLKTAAGWGQEAVAITDHGVVQAFPEAYQVVTDKHAPLPLKVIYGMEGYLYDDEGTNGKGGISRENTYHVVLLAKNQAGLRNLYELVSLSHLNHLYHRRPRIPKSQLRKKREGLFIGSACEAGEVFSALRKNKTWEELLEKAAFYDYLEIMPVVNNQFLLDRGEVKSREDLRNFNRKILSLGETAGKPVVATTDAHYKDPEDAIYRTIIQAGQGYKDAEGNKGLYLRTTAEMLEEFSYLGEEKAYEVVVTNTRRIAEEIEVIRPIPEGKFPPKIENADEILRDACRQKASAIYGNPLPQRIAERLEKELDSIIGNGYAVMYVSAKMLVEKSLLDGYLVGSRGSVGSSFAATMAGITEVNPLPPHYVCSCCKHLEWGDNEKYDCGVDMPEKRCPSCDQKMDRLGFSIPFETFLGFEGDKEPDIDLNFAGEYQSVAHRYVEEIFGKGNVFKAGTIGTIQDRTAYGYVKKYHEERGSVVNKWEVERLTQGCTQIRRTTGQHPGGIIIVPRGHDIHEFCPVQHPANDVNTDIITTHFDYHSIDHNLLKLDLLGHDVPSQIRHLQDMTGVNPLGLPLNDQAVNDLFQGIAPLKIQNSEYKFTHGTYGIPEFGTEFVRRMLDDTNPSKFADLVRISGFSHGTDVWNNNAREFIKSGVATMNEVISTRDDIMNYLILKGVPHKDSFKIMESVRKGKGVTPEQERRMKEKGIKDWYIESCKRIKYMFPRAHAVAYVMMSYRIAYYKVYHPAPFYAAFFTSKRDDFNSELIQQDAGKVYERIQMLNNKGRSITEKEKNEITVLEVMYEMFSRGLEFLPPRLGHSHPLKFYCEGQQVRVPLAAISGVGEAAAKTIQEEYEKKPFVTVEDIRNRGKANNTAIGGLKMQGVLEGIPESDQISLFEMG
jgi:DNA polymerase-3 subunit alpha (Gram-positive type)